MAFAIESFAGEKKDSQLDVPTMIYHARELRNMLAEDPYRPKYHFVPPEGKWNDVNGMIFWKGRYHLFYLSRTINPELNKKLKTTKGQQKAVMETWGHSSSIDLVHWVHHPFALVPAYDGTMPKGIFSGDMMDNMDVPTIIAHVPEQGTCIWQAQDDMLLDWKPLKENPVIPEKNPPSKDIKVFDTTGWKEGDTFYVLIGNRTDAKGFEGDCSSLVKSNDLINWEYVGPFYKSRREWTPDYYDAACIDFFPLQDKYMMVTHVHNPGNHSQYYIGRYEKGKRFIPEQHGLFASIRDQVMAPETMSDDKGRRIFMAWNSRGYNPAWKSMSVLPRVFSIDSKGRLQQTPVEELKKLRFNHRKETPVTITADSTKQLKTISGTCIEINVTIQTGDYEKAGVMVYQSPDGSEQTIIGYDQDSKQLYVDFTKSKKGGANVAKYAKRFFGRVKGLKQEYVTQQTLPLELDDGEPLELQIFLDQGSIEVFANKRQVLVQNVYPEGKASTHVSLFSEGGDAEFSTIEAWDMHQVNAF
jgi:beta-fructofuranosidase